jgi:hypothetical protein
MEPSHVPRLLALTCLLLILALTGCAVAKPVAEGAPSAGDGMMGGGEEAGMLAGAIASAKNASMTLGPNPSSASGVRVERLLAPSDGWLVVRAARAKGAVLSLIHISEPTRPY